VSSGGSTTKAEKVAELLETVAMLGQARVAAEGNYVASMEESAAQRFWTLTL
jgi:hypothetical protein